MRDAVFVELAQYATTESAVGALLSALLAVMRTAPEGAVGALFGTASMRDRVFVPIAPLVTSTHVLPFWEAVVGICKDGEARRLFATPGIRHCFFQLAKRVVTADAADWCARALCSITQPAEGAALFAVSHTVGMLHRLSKRGGLVTVLQTCCAFASILQHEPKVRVVFATPVMVKVFARLAEHAATGDAASVLFRDLFSFLKGKEAKTVFGAATGAVCGVFLRLAGRVVMSTAVTEACGCLYYVLQHSTPEAQAAFATEAVRDGVFLRLAIHACSTNAVVNLVGALCYLLHNNAKALAVFATSSVRDGVLVRLTKHAECARADIRTRNSKRMKEVCSVGASHGGDRRCGDGRRGGDRHCGDRRCGDRRCGDRRPVPGTSPYRRVAIARARRIWAPRRGQPDHGGRQEQRGTRCDRVLGHLRPSSARGRRDEHGAAGGSALIVPADKTSDSLQASNCAVPVTDTPGQG